ncbi:MAG: DUF4340 domain-containing protein [Planctomycetota bacterium]
MDAVRTGGPRGQGELSGPARRTATFLAVGLGLLLVGGWLQLRPALRSRTVTTETAVGKPLFPDLSDAAKAASLEIVSFDEDTATLAPFKVVKSGGVWVLPSHQNYPADAKEQLAAAATELVDRPIVDLVSTSPGDHELYGVKEPDADKVKVGETGVGQLVEIRDASGNKLARLIVGKEFKRPGGANAAGRTLRYVRRAGQDPVYLAELDTSKFTTKFDAWIEKDLLKLSPWDVTRLTIDDSSWSLGIGQGGAPTIAIDRTSLIELAYDDKEAKWSLVGLTDFGKGNKPEKKELAAGEELASTKLNDLRNGLGDLKIVDVVRKPAGLSAELKADKKFTDDEEAVMSLAQRGFFPVESGEVLSSSGETVVGMKDGVEYLLRFGNTTTVAGDEGTKEDAEGDEAAAGRGGRYLFVLARFNEALLEKPQLQPVPEVPEDAEQAKDEQAKDGQAKEDDGKQPGDEKPAEGEGGAEAGDALSKADEAEAKAQAALEERRRVERENRLAQEAYDEKVKAAQKRVRELNSRFADWYYVVSDSEYAKIRLGRADVIQAKPADEPPPAPATP